MSKIRLILGTMTFGPQVDTHGSFEMMNTFLEEGYNELDTAYVYNNGDTEKLLGDIINQFDSDSFSIATKIHPRITTKLDAHAVTMQFEESLRRLNRDSVDILYFHFPDPVTPLESALQKCAELHQMGKFKELGLSNFPAWMVADIWHICKSNDWPTPSVYQGMYNGLTRNVEAELFSALRKFGMRFYAFNPLAGGMLTGKHANYEKKPAPGRFARLQSYRDRYWKKTYIDAVNKIKSICLDYNIKTAEAAYRWLVYHSHLDGSKGDGLIIGASSMKQFEENLISIKKGPLPDEIAAEFDGAWEAVRGESPSYFRFFTSL